MRIYPTYLSLTLKAFLSLKQKPKAYVGSNIKFRRNNALPLLLVSAKLFSKDEIKLVNQAEASNIIDGKTF